MFSSVDTMWVLIGAALVFFMQAGFAMVETGFTRAKNAGNIIMKNIMDFSIGTILFWVIGFGIMFGANDGPLAPFIGGLDFFVRGDYSGSFPTSAFLIFQTVFCATAATIVSGAMAERTKFLTYCFYSAILSAIIYPISGHWIWGGGWLSQMGFTDFAGSTAVHMVGGVAALVGAKVLGPRIGKFGSDGKPRAIPGHSLTLGALGVFILWFCWFGFNGASTVSMTDGAIVQASNVFVTTNIAAAAAAFSVMIITWVKYKKPDVSMTLNGALAGLVGITAGCHLVSPAGAVAIGVCCAFAVVFGIEAVEKVLKIDDPVGAVGVHGICGALGTILTGVFALEGGLAYGYGWSFVGVQTLGVLAVAAWVFVTMGIVFIVLKKTIGLRVSDAEEIIGLDIEEHGLANSYADFMPTVMGTDFHKDKFPIGAAPVEDAIKVVDLTDAQAVPVAKKASGEHAGDKMTKVVIVTKRNKFEHLKLALDGIGITGMTVTQVMGCGMQRGDINFYRGVQVETKLLPKVKIEIVVCKVPVDLVVKTATEALYTGAIGDGKIFIYNVENVIKVRTAEEGFDALQDE